MRFYEYEAREIVKRAGIPVTDYGFTRDAAEAAEIAARIGGPVVVKSQVLSGGGVEEGGVPFPRPPPRPRARGARSPRPRDRRPPAARRPRRPARLGRAGVLRERLLGRHPQAP